MNHNIVTRKPSSFILATIIFLAVLCSANIIWAANVFIDPTASPGGNGSFANPFNSWSSVNFTSSNDYFQKCGTKATLNSNITVHASGTENNKIVIGPYYNSRGVPVLKLSGPNDKPIVDRGTKSEGSTFTLKGNHIRLANFDCRQGESSVRVRGANCIVEYNVIGESARWGIRVEGADAVNTIIRYNIVDSKGTIYNNWGDENANSEDGIAMTGGSSHTQVYNNFIGSWDHNGIIFNNSDYNEAYKNTATNPYKVNMRFFGIALGSDYNKIHNNWIEGMDARSQIGAGIHNEVYKNIFYTMTDKHQQGQGACVWFQGIGGSSYVSKYNKVYNNIIYSIKREGVAFYNNPGDGKVQGNQVYKNVIVNTGLEGTDLLWIDTNSDGVFEQTIRDNFIFNENGEDSIKYRGSILSISEFNQKNGYDTISNNRWQDPKFKDPQNGDFSFQNDSPLIGSGIEPVNIHIFSIDDLLNAGVSKLMPPILKIAQQ
jgi:hypothetical protein